MLVIRPEWIDTLTEIHLHADGLLNTSQQDLEAQKQHEIAKREKEKHKVGVLFRNDIISESEFERDIQRLKREIQIWKEKTSERQQVALNLQLCSQALQELQTVWETGTDEDRQGMAANRACPRASRSWLPMD